MQSEPMVTFTELFLHETIKRRKQSQIMSAIFQLPPGLTSYKKLALASPGRLALGRQIQSEPQKQPQSGCPLIVKRHPLANIGGCSQDWNGCDPVIRVVGGFEGVSP